MSSCVNVRPIQPEDLEDAIAVFKSGVLSYPEHNEPHIINFVQYDIIEHAIKTDLGNIETTYKAPGGNFWVATLSEEDQPEKIVGIVGLEQKSEGEGELRRMFVQSGYRGFGIGRLLVNNLEAWAKANGFNTVWLSTGKRMKPAQKFYASLGYTPTRCELISKDPLYETMYFTKQL